MVDLGFESVGNALASLSTAGVVLAVLIALAFVGVGVLIGVNLPEPFIPIEASLLPQRAVTNAIAQGKRDNHPVALPSKWNPAIEPPMLTRVMIDNKLRGDELQKELQKLNRVESPLNKFL